MADDLAARRASRKTYGRARAPVGSFGPGPGKQAAIDKAMDKVRSVEQMQGPPTPERITLALDSRGMYGPGVDHACGREEPAVDRWEAGEEVPTADEMRRLATLTGYPIGFFYMPAPEPLGSVLMCEVWPGEDPVGDASSQAWPNA